MAVPPLGSYPANTWSLALIRYNVGTGEGTFVCLIGDQSFYAEALPAGTWRYETWLVMGQNTGGSPVQRVVYNGRARLVVQHSKR